MKTKKMSKVEYIKTFCQDLRIRKRKAVYVDQKIYDFYMEVTKGLKKHTHISLSAYITMILFRHQESNSSILNEFIEEGEKTVSKQTNNGQPVKSK